MIFLSVGFVVLIAFVLGAVLTPRVVEYVEMVVIEASPERVHDAVRYQSDLMRWSAWPKETGTNCAVEGQDGRVGARTVFLDKRGRKFGYQEITDITKHARVSFKLESKGPPHTPTMDIYTVPSGENRTMTLLHFRNEIAPPFHLFLHVFGVVRWTRDMHNKDLTSLKRFVESGVDYEGRPTKEAA